MTKEEKERKEKELLEILLAKITSEGFKYAMENFSGELTKHSVTFRELLEMYLKQKRQLWRFLNQRIEYYDLDF